MKTISLPKKRVRISTPESREKKRLLNSSDHAKRARKEYNKTEKGKAVRNKSEKKRRNTDEYKLRTKAKRSSLEALKERRKREGSERNVLINRCRCRIRNALKAKKITKTSLTSKMIGCSWEALKSHLEKQFSKKMNWKNKNEWEIDHIIPLSSAKTKNEILRLSHFSNLRPLWANENRTKGNKIVTCQPELTLEF